MRRLILPILCLILLGSAGCAGGTNADPGTNGPGKTDPGKTDPASHTEGPGRAWRWSGGQG